MRTTPASMSRLTDHVRRQVDRIESRFAPGTALLRFGNGDLGGHPPAGGSRAARSGSSSSWTVELAYETLGRYRVALERRGGPADLALANRLADLCALMRADFNRLLVPDGIVAGLVELGADGPDAPAPPARPAHRRALPADPDDPRRDQRHVHAGPGPQAHGGRAATPVLPGRRAPDGPADGLPRRDRDPVPPRRVGRLVRARDRAAVRPRASPLRAGDGAARHGRRGVRRAARRVPGRHRALGAQRARRARRTRTSAARTPPSPIATRRAAGSAGCAAVGSASRGGWRVYSSGPGIFLAQLVERIMGIRGCVRRRGHRPGAAPPRRRRLPRSRA